jgi:hypothetical protein
MPVETSSPVAGQTKTSVPILASLTRPVVVDALERKGIVLTEGGGVEPKPKGKAR